MTDRRLWLVAALLALAGIALNIVLWITRQRTNEQTFEGPPRSDYTLTDFTLNALDAEGKLSFQTIGPRLARRGEDGSIFVTTPDYVIYDGNGHEWKGKSDSAWVNKEGTIMKLDGHVEMHRQPAAGRAAGRRRHARYHDLAERQENGNRGARNDRPARLYTARHRHAR